MTRWDSRALPESGAKPVLAILTPHPTGVNGFDLGTGSTEIAPDQSTGA
ncbi:MAG: hypothetical protein QOJ08_2341 [Ilumatobacteraceae bacterium]